MAQNTPSNTPEVELGEAVRSLSAGQFIFNRYSLVKLMGHGRNSAVWQAWDDKESRDVALKFLGARLVQDAEAMADIKRVVDRVATLQVPQAARIYGLEVEGKLAAVAEQLIEGDSLHALRGQKKSAVFDAVDLKEWLKQITKTLEQLHAAGFGHGNLKPTNLLLSPKGEVVITDAGIDARIGHWINKLDGNPRDLSQSARYASPQQAKGQEPTATDDVYSLGVCLYELITSKPPFNSGNIQSQVMEDVPPSMTRRRRDMRIIGEPIPRAWDETIAACLAKEPEKRPQNMAEVADWLELYGPSKRAAAAPAPDATTMAAAAAAIAAAPKPSAPTPTASLGGAPQPTAAGKKNLIPIIAVAAGVILGVGGWYISTHGLGGGGDNLAFNPEGTTTKTNAPEVSAEEIERKVQLEVEAMRRKYEEETKKLELEKKRQEEELEKRRQAIAATAAAAKKAQEEAEARQRLAEEEAKKRQADVEAKRLQAEADSKRLQAEREALRQREEEMRKITIAAAQTNESEAAKAERLRREKELVEQQIQIAKMAAAAKKAQEETEAIKAAAVEATKKLEAEKAAALAAAKKAEDERIAAEAAAKKALEDDATKKAELDKKLADAERQRMLAEADNRRKIEEAARRAAQERELKMAKLTEEQRKADALKKAAADKARQEQEAQLMAQASLVGNRPGSAQIWHNTLGMRMVPLGDAYICAWETRLQDYEEFVRLARYGADAKAGWKSPGFKQTPTHPVVNVNYDDALAFCNWLTTKERAENIIGADQLYRLPTDQEWSRAAELGNESGATPEERSDRVQGQYPWGAVWPPPPGAGNYSDGVSYDRFDNTAPVASFMPNRLGVHDLGGNVWEWCMDWGDAGQKRRVLRGGSFFGYIPGTLAASHRLLLDGKDRRYDNGFRVVLAK